MLPRDAFGLLAHINFSWPVTLGGGNMSRPSSHFQRRSALESYFFSMALSIVVTTDARTVRTFLVWEPSA